MVQSKNIKKNYGGYPTEFVVTYGWSIAAAFLIIALIISLKKWNAQIHSDSAKLEKNGKIEVFHNEWISDYDDGYWNSSHLGGLALSIANLFKKR